MTPIARLRALDQELNITGHRLTLASPRDHATPLHALGEHLLEPNDPLGDAFVDTLCAVVRAKHENFPENLLWDIDYLAAQMLTQAKAAPAPLQTLKALGHTVVQLQRLFGAHSVIRFRYIHDFIYGFDWAKWVRRDPETRAHVGPFDPIFLAYLTRRGRELLELIKNDDTKYPKLPDGRPRNPFGFSREPTEELRLHRTLAAKKLLPVDAWNTDASPSWAQDFGQCRAQEAQRMGIGHR